MGATTTGDPRGAALFTTGTDTGSIEIRSRSVSDLAVIRRFNGPELRQHLNDHMYVAKQWTSPARRDPSDFWALLRRYRDVAVAVDVAAALGAALTACVIRFGAQSRPTYIAFSVVVAGMWAAIVMFKRGYDTRFLGQEADEFRSLISAGPVLFVMIAIIAYTVREDISRGYVLLAVPATVLLSLMGRGCLRLWLRQLRRHGRGLQRALVVGHTDVAVPLMDKIGKDPRHGLKAVGACLTNFAAAGRRVCGVPVLGSQEHILDAALSSGADSVLVVSDPELSGHALRRLSWTLAEEGIDLIVSPGIIEVSAPRLSIRPVAGISLLHVERPAPNHGRMLSKTIFDRSAALALLLAASPFLVALAVAVKVTSSGPVFFRQRRIGIDGRAFTMLKFRSMVVNAEELKGSLAEKDEGNGLLFKMKNDPRVTRVGGVLRRYSLDELPQLINVLRGEMSLVGPRPPLPTEVARYSSDASRRLRVRPGLTGLWQVSGRSDLSLEESLLLDLRYVDNWSMAMDLSILCRTVRAVVGGSGAY